jgi:hypothetical protein
MKPFSLIIFLLFAGITHASVTPEGEPETSGPVAKTKKTVLVVGLKNGNITSNYYVPEIIAEKTAVDKDSLEDVFSRIIVESMNRSNENEFHIISIKGNKSKNSFLNKVNFKYEKELMVSDLSELSDSEFQNMMKQYNADYILILGHYYLKYEGGSNLFHIIQYDVYNLNKKNIISDNAFFNTPELLPLANFEKKYTRSGSRIIDQLHKASN